MAEPASSIITITTVSLAIIKKTATFIQEARVVDHVIAKLYQSLLDIRHLLKVVDSTCRKATTTEDDPSRFVLTTLKRCHLRLEDVQRLVEDLGSRKSGTILQKVAIKIRSDRSKKEIDEAIEDIARFNDQIHKGISLWNLHLTSVIDRRTSESVPVMQGTSIRNDMQQIDEIDTLTPITRAWSDAETVYESFPDSTTAYGTTSQAASRPSLSSTSTHSQRVNSHRSDSLISEGASEKPRSEWVDFHYQIKVCEGSEARMHSIRKALEQHPESSLLANCTDGSRRSPLHLAAQRGDVQLARILLDFSADIDAKDSQPSSVLDLAVEHNREDFVAFLVDHGVDETAVSKQHHDRFEEMKEVMELRNNTKSKNSKDSRNSKTHKKWRSRTGIAA